MWLFCQSEKPIWRALGACLLGAAKTGLGRPEEGLAELDDGIALYQGLRTPPVFWPLILFVRAGACARSGRPAEGLGFVDEAIAIAETTSGLTLVPELYSLKGHLLLLLPEADDARAERAYHRAFEAAGDSGGRMMQLRAAIGLCAAQRERGDAGDGSELLRGVYARFTEGFTSPDLIEAAEVLGRLSEDAAARRLADNDGVA